MEKRKSLCCVAVCLLLVGCAEASFTSERNAENISLPQPKAITESSVVVNEGEISGAAVSTRCFTLEELVQGAAGDLRDSRGYEIYPEEILQQYREALENNHVYNWPGEPFDEWGVTITLEDIWYERTTQNMVENYYPQPEGVDNPIYIFLTLNVHNATSKTQTFYINEGSLQAFPSEANPQSADFIYQNHVIDPIPNNTSYALCTIPAGESQEYTIAYFAGEGFAAYTPTYLKWTCYPPELAPNAGSYETLAFEPYDLWVKLPTLAER